jgi:hypothetical protein
MSTHVVYCTNQGSQTGNAVEVLDFACHASYSYLNKCFKITTGCQKILIGLHYNICSIFSDSLQIAFSQM